MEVAQKVIHLKCKDEVSDVLNKITENIAEMNELLRENKELLSEVIKGGLEVVNTPLGSSEGAIDVPPFIVPPVKLDLVA